MGRRKERRLAAMSTTGRRVKLDLFAEPSGDLGGSSAQNEVGGDDDDTKNQAGLPNSPSSSDKLPENPLVLLGQYSDDELDERPSGEQEQAVSGDASVILDDQAKPASEQGKQGSDFEEGNGPGAQKVEDLEVENALLEVENALQLMDSMQKTEIGGTTVDNAPGSGVLPEEVGLKDQASAVSDPQTVGDVVLGWKVVFHEETNRYYYWNTTTGETSWEVPDVLAQATEYADGKKDAADTGENERATHSFKFTVQKTEINGINANMSSEEVINEACRVELLDETKGKPDLEQNHSKSISPPKRAENHATSPGSDKNAEGIESLMYESEKDLSAYLMKRSEHLLEQLNSRSKCNLQGTNQILKYVLEVELRLADMKSLASYGSSILPFWLHSERRLQQLEIAVNDALRSLESEKFQEVEKKTVSSSSGDSGTAQSTEVVELPKNDIEVYSQGVSGTELVSPVGSLETFSDFNVGGKSEVDALTGHCDPKTVLHSEEEVDMDIDMEVEDDTPTSSSTIADPSGAQYHASSAGQESAAAGYTFSVPPPPEEDWIPPPPSDDEPFPPPPPEEPPEIPYPQPSDLVPVQSFSYPQQYDMSYTGPNYDYYAQTNADFPSSNLYVTAEACQPTLSHAAVYFEPLPDTYGPATLAANPVEPGAFYSLQNGMTQLPVQSSVFESNTVQNTSVMGPFDAHVEVDSTSLLNKVNVPATDEVPKKASLEIPSSQASCPKLANTSETEGVSLPSVSSGTAPVASAATSKAQSKVIRKKRTVAAVSSLRSNKKVSSLVDKWKAAKEELQEEEEEPKTAFEILEKKRQREIEEWRAQQIASGEAKYNANFQPLGGDWRERVKRKRAKLASEPSQNPSDAVPEENQQPDFDELSKGLPKGWQAYWDDSSKQVYYGNSVTSETTWIRPTS